MRTPPLEHNATLLPPLKPRLDMGAGLERIAAVMQGVASTYHTDLFQPLLDRVAVQAFAGVDILIHSAGIWPAEDVPVHEMTDERWHRGDDSRWAGGDGLPLTEEIC